MLLPDADGSAKQMEVDLEADPEADLDSDAEIMDKAAHMDPAAGMDNVALYDKTTLLVSKLLKLELWTLLFIN